MSKDLRKFLSKIENEYPEELQKIEKKVDPLSFEISAIIQHLINQNRQPIILFKKTKNLKGNVSKITLAYNLFATRELCALSLDLPVNHSNMELSLEFSKREIKKIDPVIIKKKEAPVKDVIKLGREVDIKDLPVARYHEMDLGPYLTMANIMKNEEGNFYDVSFCKNMVVNSKTLTVSLHHTERHHLTNILESNDEKDLPTPIVIVLGHHPAFYLGAGALKEFGNNDYETIGSFLQEPLRLTPSECWGEKFLVPADSEIIIEGEVIPKKRVIQNPFGEYSGYYQPQCLMPVMRVKAMSYRKDAIMQGIFPGHDCHFNIGSIPKEGSIYNGIIKVVPEVVGVHLPHSGAGRLSCYVSIKKTREGDAKKVGLMPFLFSEQIKYVIVVDDEIDIYNEKEVMWAMITRLNVTRGVDIIRNMPRGDRVIIDATKPLDRPFPEKNKVPDEIMENIRLEDYLT